jgi:serine/threonine protein kinase
MVKIIIGKGSHGTVYKTTSNVAVKRITLKDFIPIEAIIMSTIDHPCLNRAKKIQIQTGGVYIFQDLAHTDLHKYCTKILINHKQAIKWTTEISQGLHFLHRHSILHADIKLANILLFTTGNDMSAKITDFTLSMVKKYVHLDYPDTIAYDDHGTTMICTANYRPPEVWKRLAYNQKADIWSLGCLIFEMINQQSMFPYRLYEENPNTALDIIKMFVDNRDKYMTTYSIEHQKDHPLTSIVFRCLSYNPKDRPDACELFVEDIAGKIFSSACDAYADVDLYDKIDSQIHNPDLSMYMSRNLRRDVVYDPGIEKIEMKTLKELNFMLDIYI